MRATRRRVACVAASVLLSLVAGASAARAQSLLERPPNMSGGWVGNPGTVYFDFLHRFTTSDPPARKVANSPTFLVAAGLPWHLLAGFNYATNSDVAPRYPNEWEPFARWAPLAQDEGRILDVAVQGGWNVAARSTDGELSIGRRVGRLHLHGAARFLSDAYDSGEAKTGLAGGAVLRLGRWMALAGDWATLLDRPAGFEPAWSAALHLAIPYSPHTLSLQVTNANTATLQGLSAARSKERRYGFEFTIPITLRRYFARTTTLSPVRAAASDSAATAQVLDTTHLAAAPAVAAAPIAPAARDTTVRDATIRESVPRDTMVRVPVAPSPTRPRGAVRAAPRLARAGMRQLAFTPARIEVAAGGTVTWTNRDAMVHTVTDAAGTWDSGLIEPGKSWSRRFDKPGTYAIHCTPHPFMKAVVVVRPAEAP